MREPSRSKPFLQSDDQMLWLGLLQRDTGTPASQHLGVRDEVLALDFNLAVTLRLSRYDNEREAQAQKNLAIRITNQVGRMLNGGEEDEVNDLIANDPYADENTQIM